MSKIGGLFIALILPSAGAFVAAQCPDGFVNLGRVSAQAPAGRYQEVKATRELSFKDGIDIDDSYRQRSIQAASDGGASNMRAAQIPAGFYLVPGGPSGGAWWSIENPELVRVPETSDKPVHWVFQIDLYANTGGRTPALQQQQTSQDSPSVWVDVCIKPRGNPTDSESQHTTNTTK
jgi:hypothetical protein